jgi:beta-galactosidase
MKFIDLNNDWIVYKKENPQESENVSVPHCFNAIDGQNGTDMFKGEVCYVKTLHITKEQFSHYLFLEIGAAALVSSVYVNDKLVGNSRCGFSLYRMYLNSFLQLGENKVLIIVDNRQYKDVYPLMADFSFYGGLYRYVKLLEVEDIHFDLLDDGRDGVYLTQKYLKSNKFELSVMGRLVNEDDSRKTIQISLRLLDALGNLVLEEQQQQIVEKTWNFAFKKQIDNPHRWQGVIDPYLYCVEVIVCYAGKIIDNRTIYIGFRTVEVTAGQGLLLNGKHIKICGVSRHQDFYHVGNAITKKHMDLDMSIIKEIGANSVRLAHYQHDDYFYELCDKEGILVWAEIPFISIPTTTDEMNINAKLQLRKLIKQAYNHTSIYCWGVQNEITIAIENEKIYKMVQELVNLARDLDASRFVGQANIHSVENQSSLNKLTDVAGYNLYYGWYYQEINDFDRRLEEFHKEVPTMSLIITEYGVDANPQYHSYEPAVKDYSEEYQLVFLDNALRTINEKEFVIGGYVWSLFDFGSDLRNEGGKKGQNQKGLISIDRTLKKDAFYLYKAYWSKCPFVKLAGSRFMNRHKESNEIIVFSNLPKVILKRNGGLVEESNGDLPVRRFSNIKLDFGKNYFETIAFDADGIAYHDEMILNYVAEADLSYIMQENKLTNHVVNWFKKFDLTSIGEVKINKGYYSTFDTIESIYANGAAREVFQKYFGNIMEKEPYCSMKGLMTINSMSKRSRFHMPKELLDVINRELNVIAKI